MIEAGDSLIMVDCGFGVKETERRFETLGVSLKDVDAILVTHEHGDHIKGVGPVARRYKMPVYMTEGTHLARDIGNIPVLNKIERYQAFSIADLVIQPVSVPHDAREPAQFVISYGLLKLGILSDLGKLTSHVISHYQDCDAVMVEANHDLDLLAEGPYPFSLQRRVASDWGHLNNSQTRGFLESIDLSRLQHLVIGHISEKNNAIDVVNAELQEIMAKVESYCIADQRAGFPWLNLV